MLQDYLGQLHHKLSLNLNSGKVNSDPFPWGPQEVSFLLEDLERNRQDVASSGEEHRWCTNEFLNKDRFSCSHQTYVCVLKDGPDERGPLHRQPKANLIKSLLS